MQKIFTSLALTAALVAGFQASADAQMRTSTPTRTKATVVTTAPAAPMLGVGYKLGNGIGFVGADVIVNPMPNLSLDLQMASFDGGFAYAPSIQYHLDMANGPYVGVGYRGELNTASKLSGVFGNVGWHYMPMPNVGLTAGVGYQKVIGAPDEFNYEAGIRYFFM